MSGMLESTTNHALSSHASYHVIASQNLPKNENGIDGILDGTSVYIFRYVNKADSMFLRGRALFEFYPLRRNQMLLKRYQNPRGKL